MFLLFLFYSSSGALTGHTPAHVPHPIHTSLSITYVVSPCDMQDTGHSAAHAPQLIHLSVILYAIFVPSFITLKFIFIRLFCAQRRRVKTIAHGRGGCVKTVQFSTKYPLFLARQYVVAGACYAIKAVPIYLIGDIVCRNRNMNATVVIRCLCLRILPQEVNVLPAAGY